MAVERPLPPADPSAQGNRAALHHRSFNSVNHRFQKSLFLAFLVAVAGTVTAGYFLRQSGRSATEDQHVRETTIAGARGHGGPSRRRPRCRGGDPMPLSGT